jgi:hypothetical protein
MRGDPGPRLPSSAFDYRPEPPTGAEGYSCLLTDGGVNCQGVVASLLKRRELSRLYVALNVIVVALLEMLGDEKVAPAPETVAVAPGLVVSVKELDHGVERPVTPTV